MTVQLEIFRSEGEYMRAQKRSRQRRDKRNTKGWAQEEFDQILRWLNDQNFLADRIICHGVGRDAEEVKMFKRKYRTSTVIGTDLFPGNELCIQHDFRQEVPEWRGHFNILYSNSLDHSDRPRETIQRWLDQLAPGGKTQGVGFIQWNVKHNSTGGGDCFGANLHEYILLFEQYGEVYDLLYCGNTVVVLVVGRKKDEASQSAAD